MQLKTEEHEKKIAEFIKQVVNSVLTLHDSRLVIAVFYTGKLDLNWVQKVWKSYLCVPSISRLGFDAFFDAFWGFRKQVNFE